MSRKQIDVTALKDLPRRRKLALVTCDRCGMTIQFEAPDANAEATLAICGWRFAWHGFGVHETDLCPTCSRHVFPDPIIVAR